MDVHYFDHEEERKEEEEADDFDVADAVAADFVVEDDCARSILDVGRATFVPPPDRRLTDRGRAIVGGNS